MTPEQYRAKWNLPADYPMVDPNYDKARSELAKSMGLGQQWKKGSANVKAAAEAPAAAKGRPTKKAA